MSKHFCCCIPVRAAVFFLSFLSFLSGLALAAISWYTLWAIQGDKTVGGVDFGDISTTGKIAFIVSGSIFSLTAFVSLCGFIGSIARKRRLVKAYAALTWVIFLVSLAAAGFLLYAVFSGKDLFKGCQFTDPKDNTVHECVVNFATWQKALATVVVLVGLLVLLYIAIIIGRYVDQLELEHDDYKLAHHSQGGNYAPTYYPPTAQDQSLLNSGHSYPYADAQHSFGAHA